MTYLVVAIALAHKLQNFAEIINDGQDIPSSQEIVHGHQPVNINMDKLHGSCGFVFAMSSLIVYLEALACSAEL